MSRDPPLEVRCDRHKAAVVVAVEGELDLGTVDVLRTALRGPEAVASTVVLDLRNLVFIDSTGLSLLVEEQHRARDEGFRLVVAIGGARTVERLFELTGLHNTLTLVDQPDAALVS